MHSKKIQSLKMSYGVRRLKLSFTSAMPKDLGKLSSAPSMRLSLAEALVVSLAALGMALPTQKEIATPPPRFLLLLGPLSLSKQHSCILPYVCAALTFEICIPYHEIHYQSMQVSGLQYIYQVVQPSPLILNIFITPKRNPFAANPFFPQPLAITSLLSVSTGLPVPGCFV